VQPAAMPDVSPDLIVVHGSSYFALSFSKGLPPRCSIRSDSEPSGLCLWLVITSPDHTP
jgi:hypothetical protein